MSDVASLRQLKPASAQLPVGWYFDPEVFAQEKKLLFDAGPNYVGHELMVPKAGDYRTLAWKDHSQVLVRNAGGVELLSNVCRHRQSIMLQGAGNTQNIVCPFHRWTYDMQGELLGAPHFPQNPCVRLHSTPLKNWNGLLFAGPRDPARDLERFSLACDFDFSRLCPRPRDDRRLRLQLEDFHRGLPRGLSRRALPPGTGRIHRLRRLQRRLRRGVFAADRAGEVRADEARHAGVPQVARGLPEGPRRPRAEARRALWDDLLSGHDARVVPACAGGLAADPARPAAHHQRGRVLLPRGDRAVRARVHRGPAGRIHGNRHRGRRAVHAHGPRPQGAVGAGSGRCGPLPVADGRRDAALPRVAAREGSGGRRSVEFLPHTRRHRGARAAPRRPSVADLRLPPRPRAAGARREAVSRRPHPRRAVPASRRRPLRAEERIEWTPSASGPASLHRAAGPRRTETRASGGRV